MGLFTTSIPTAKFTQIGDSVVGRIVDIGQQQRTEYLRDGGIGEPMFWSGGRPVAGAEMDPRTGQPNKPVMDHVITLETGAADENGVTERRVFVKGKAELASIKQACKDAGVRDIEVGGVLKKTWISGAGGTSDPRVYEYKYKAPAGDDDQARAVREAVPEVLERMKRAHESSPLMQRAEAKAKSAPASFDDEPPF